MKSDIKVGDYVVCLISLRDEFTKGKIYKVKGIRPHKIYIEKDDSNRINNWYNPCRSFIKIEEKDIEIYKLLYEK